MIEPKFSFISFGNNTQTGLDVFLGTVVTKCTLKMYYHGYETYYVKNVLQRLPWLPWVT